MRKKTGLGVKKELNAELNLTPFIDLLSTCVCFLLITAVWIEIGTVEIKQNYGTQASASKSDTYDIDVVFRTSQSARINLKKNGKRLKAFNIKENDFESFLKTFNSTLKSKVLNFKSSNIKIASATITPRSSVDYGSLVSTLDVLRKNEIVNIGVLTTKGR